MTAKAGASSQSALQWGQGQVVVWSFRAPAAGQLNSIQTELGDAAGRVQFVHGIEGLYNWIKFYFGI